MFRRFIYDPWKGAIRFALTKTNAIFIIPSFHEGTLWEIEQIAGNSKYLKMTRFVIPFIKDAESPRVVAYWQNTFDAIHRRLGITFETRPYEDDDQYLLMLEGSVWCVDEGKLSHHIASLHFWRPQFDQHGIVPAAQMSDYI
jgi:hypothetical protein